MSPSPVTGAPWPELPYAAWKDTCATLHRWTQIVGKIRLMQSPWVNHSWHVTLYVTARGLTTSPIPYGKRTLQIDFDFLDHTLDFVTSDGARRVLPLAPRSVATFYAEVRAALRDLGLDVRINPRPSEIPDPTPLDRDETHASYDADAAQRWWRVMIQADRVFKTFRAGFLGKCSPVHLFWGGFDHAVTRFSGRPAPPHPGGVPNLPDWIAREAYSHEVSSCGFWPGGDPLPEPVFYSYAYPEPAGFRTTPVRPEAATFHEGLGEFVLPYEAVRTAREPEAMLLEFLQSTYEAAADCAGWDRSALERAPAP